MIKKIDRASNINRSLKRYIKKLRPFKGGEWAIKSDELKLFKKYIEKNLMSIQDKKCAYCGFSFCVTSNPEIEHIAPKGGAKIPNHVDLTFSRYNLVLACRLCNGFFKKGTKETVVKKDKDYRKYEFNIVHPYFDDPDDHYIYIDRFLISGKTEKGINGIKIFKLDDSAHVIQRAKDFYFENIPKKDQDIINNILRYTR